MEKVGSPYNPDLGFGVIVVDLMCVVEASILGIVSLLFQSGMIYFLYSVYHAFLKLDHDLPFNLKIWGRDNWCEVCLQLIMPQIKSVSTSSSVYSVSMLLLVQYHFLYGRLANYHMLPL